MFYSKSTGGFYDKRISSSIPDDVVEITREQHRVLLDGQSTGKRIVTDADGKPYLDDPVPPTIEQLAAQQRDAIDTARNQAFAAGMPYVLPDGSDEIVQTRPKDQLNLMSMSMQAKRLVDKGVTEPVMPFRGESNVDRMLTPEQMLTMTNAADAHILAIYEKSWKRKDAVTRALKLEDSSEINKVEW